MVVVVCFSVLVLPTSPAAVAHMVSFKGSRFLLPLVEEKDATAIMGSHDGDEDEDDERTMMVVMMMMMMMVMMMMMMMMMTT